MTSYAITSLFRVSFSLFRSILFFAFDPRVQFHLFLPLYPPLVLSFCCRIAYLPPNEVVRRVSHRMLENGLVAFSSLQFICPRLGLPLPPCSENPLITKRTSHFPSSFQ